MKCRQKRTQAKILQRNRTSYSLECGEHRVPSLRSGFRNKMAIDEKSCWDKKYDEHSHSSLEADPFLLSAYGEFLAGRAPGNALDVAGGVGRHAIWLAQQGWRVKLLDISEVGIKQAAEKSKRTETAGSGFFLG